MILDELRSATRGIHAEMEGRLPLGKPELPLAEYRELVAAFHGFVVPLERELMRNGHARQDGFDYAERIKTQKLEADRAALGLEEAGELAGPEELPPLETKEEVFGCLYVIEGSTLGGQVISRSLAKNLGIGAENGAAYFSGYGEKTGERWKEFLAALAAVAETGDHSAITRSAVTTFEALNHWLFDKKG